MTLAVINSRAALGIEAPAVTIEVHITPGIPSLSIVGLPEAAVKESKDRVRSAILNSGLEFPTRRITINLAPADLPKKDGGRYDLPIAIGILVASQQLTVPDLEQYEFAGELALDGGLRRITGALLLGLAAKKDGHVLVLPIANGDEAGLVGGLNIIAKNSLLDLVAVLVKAEGRAFYRSMPRSEPVAVCAPDMNEVFGQDHAKRALEITAAGGHHLMMIGPPGVGKSMMAQRLVTILPDMDEQEALESGAIYSALGKDLSELWMRRPFRAPHHTASSVALVGGSNPPRPGEITLAHHGVLFLDELLEFNRSVLESLREPLESRYVTISRAACHAKFPANFQLVVAMNPCPCGYFGEHDHRCRCALEQVKRYRSRLSGPFLDRLDLMINLCSIPSNRIFLHERPPTSEASAVIRQRVTAARLIALQRQGKANAYLGAKEIQQYCHSSVGQYDHLLQIIEKMQLSVRTYHKILRVSRTIADLAGQPEIEPIHWQETLTYLRRWELI